MNGLTHPNNFFTVWWKALRPKTLTLAITPVLAGNALAFAQQGTLESLPIILTLIAAICVQIGTNLYNDAADFERGVDQPNRLGPARVVASGLLPAWRVYKGAHIAFGLSWLAGSYLMWIGGWFILAIAVLSTVAGYLYTAGPRPISTTPFGELTVFLFFGIAAVVGTVFLQTGEVNSASLITGMVIGLPAAAVLMVNNYRDFKNDRLAGRRTLTIVIGPARSISLFSFLMIAPLILIFALAPYLAGLIYWLWLPLAALFIALRIIKSFRNTPVSPAFNSILANTARYQTIFGALLSLSFLLSRW